MQSDLPFKLKLVTDLKNNGFGLNPYNPCVANKLVNWEVMKLVWHIDDLAPSTSERLVVVASEEDISELI